MGNNYGTNKSAVLTLNAVESDSEGFDFGEFRGGHLHVPAGIASASLQVFSGREDGSDDEQSAIYSPIIPVVNISIPTKPGAYPLPDSLYGAQYLKFVCDSAADNDKKVYVTAQS